MSAHELFILYDLRGWMVSFCTVSISSASSSWSKTCEGGRGGQDVIGSGQAGLEREASPVQGEGYVHEVQSSPRQGAPGNAAAPPRGALQQQQQRE
jgi:hypothetical protein